MQAHFHHPPASGMTMIELMVTLAIAAILVTVGVPSFTQAVRENRAQSDENQLVTALRIARSEAITRGRNVAVCPSANSTTCTNNWAQPLIVFVDPDADGVMANSDDLVRVFQNASELDIQSAPAVTSMMFRATGIASSPVVFSICDASARVQPRAVVVNVTGSTFADRTQASCP